MIKDANLKMRMNKLKWINKVVWAIKVQIKWARNTRGLSRTFLNSTLQPIPNPRLPTKQPQSHSNSMTLTVNIHLIGITRIEAMGTISCGYKMKLISLFNKSSRQLWKIWIMTHFCLISSKGVTGWIRQWQTRIIIQQLVTVPTPGMNSMNSNTEVTITIIPEKISPLKQSRNSSTGQS